jgi:hypothetical protein
MEYNIQYDGNWLPQIIYLYVGIGIIKNDTVHGILFIERIKCAQQHHKIINQSEMKILLKNTDISNRNRYDFSILWCNTNVVIKFSAHGAFLE